jgi:hypothetical protein
MGSEVLHSPAVRGAVSGVLAAAVVDLHAFLGWKNVEEFASYSWGTAALRWVQGAISGALAGAGFGALS